jgi:hypothetical protein
MMHSVVGQLKAVNASHLIVYVKFGGSLFDSFPSLLYDDRAGIVDMSGLGSYIT